jgi:hypothetical protein
MKFILLALAVVLSSCGGGTDPCAAPGMKDSPQCVPPIPLPCTYPCTDSKEGNTQ